MGINLSKYPKVVNNPNPNTIVEQEKRIFFESIGVNGKRAIIKYSGNQMNQSGSLIFSSPKKIKIIEISL
jgi:hypothetical protein